MALGAGLLVSSGCAETALVGQLDDSELQDIQVLPLAGLGISREVNDLVFGGYIDVYSIGGFTDEVAYSGVSGGESAMAIGDAENFWGSGDSSGIFEQIQEAIWAGYKVVDLAYVLYVIQGEGDGPAAFETSPIVSRSWLVAGQFERLMADHYCEAVYQYGPTGGFNVGNLKTWAQDKGFDEFALDAGKLWTKAEMYERAAFAFERAIEQADRAIAAGDTTGFGEDANNDVGYNYFEPTIHRSAAYAGLARARLSMASYGVDPSANYAAALAAAAQVPTDFADYWNTDGVNLRENQNQNLSWDNDDISHWADTLVVGGETQIWGSAFGHLVEAGDLRAARIEDGTGGIQKCYDLAIKSAATIEEIMPRDGRGNLVRLGNQGCGQSSDRVSINTVMEADEVPRWLLDNWSNEDRDIEAVHGTSARLVEAEIALINGDLATFTAKINEVRDYWGASPITQPATAGSLEFPNALDDGWSLLDREYLLNEHGQARRMGHLDRWAHPFITENHAVLPRWAADIAEKGAGYQRASCFFIPPNECNLNNQVDCPIFN
jgi:hypothetical protein